MSTETDGPLLASNIYTRMTPALLILALACAPAPGEVAQTPPEARYPVAVTTADGFIFINQAGTVISQHKYEWAEPFSEGLAAVGRDGTARYINSLGQEVLALTVQFAGPFREGLAPVSTGAAIGYIDRQGKQVVPMNYQLFSTPDGMKPQRWGLFAEGKACVRFQGQYGFIDKTGRMVIKPRFSQPSEFSQDRAAVRTRTESGFIDELGQMVIADLEPAGPFRSDLAPARQGNLFGYVTTEGVWAIEPQFTNAGPFSEGHAWAVKNGKVGFIKPDGNWSVQPKYLGTGSRFVAAAGNMSEGKAWVSREENGEPKFIYIDKTGKVLFDRSFDWADDFNQGLAYVEFDGKMALISDQGQIVWSQPFE